tara:strand:- start:18976 stop:20895 length:1920 start_codon:yes stop_codon:yes gene_type:complete
MILSFFAPFIILSIFSIFLSKNSSLTLINSFLISSITITFVIFFIGNFVSLINGIYLIFFLTLIAAIILPTKNGSTKFLKEIILKLIPIYLIIILYSSNLFFYKYDEFSEYGIISKLIFFENEIANHIANIAYKGSPSKINIMAYYNYFFLKSGYSEFREQLIYVSQITFNVVIILNILEYVVGVKKKIAFFFIIYFLCFALSPGLDKIYLETTAGLLTALIIINQTSEKENKRYIIIFTSMIFLCFLKNSTQIIFYGLTLIFIIYAFFKKDYKTIIFYISVLLFSILVEFIYFKNLKYDQINYSESMKSVHKLNYSAKNRLTNIPIQNLTSIIFSNDFITTSFKQISKSAIYHTETFLIPNKILNKLNINFNLIQIPLNFFIWILMFLILTKLININKKKSLVFFLLLSIIFLISLFITSLIWGITHNLLNKDLTVEVSWERHLGVFILGIIIYLLTLFISKNNLSFSKLLILLTITICISTPNSLRPIFNKNFIVQDQFWSSKYAQREDIDNFAKKASKDLNKYSYLINTLKDNDPYFHPILNYELIDINVYKLSIDEINQKTFFATHYLNFQKPKNIFILINNNNINILKNKINELNSNHSANTNSQENILEIISYKEFQNEEYIIYKIQINVENF